MDTRTELELDLNLGHCSWTSNLGSVIGTGSQSWALSLYLHHGSYLGPGPALRPRHCAWIWESAPWLFSSFASQFPILTAVSASAFSLTFSPLLSPSYTSDSPEFSLPSFLLLHFPVSVKASHSVMSESLRSMDCSIHARLPWTSPNPGAC